jgi:hypothetical protein
MPIDSSIALSIKPPQIADPMQAVRTAADLQASRQTQQINAERLRQEQLQTQQAEREAADVRTVRQFQEQFGGDMDKALPALAGKISPETYGKLQQGAIATKKHLGELRAQDREELKFKAGHIGAAGGLLLKTPAEQKAATWQSERNRLKAYGIELPEQYPGDEAMQGEVLDAMGLDKWLSEQRAEAGEKRATTAATDTHNAAVVNLGGQQADAAAKIRENDAAALAAAAQQGPQALAAALARLPQDRQTPFAGLKAGAKPADILKLGMKPEQQVSAGIAEQTAARSAKPNTAAELAMVAADPKVPQEDRDVANAALKVLERHAIAARPVIQTGIAGMDRPGSGGQGQTTGDEFLKTLPSSIAAQVRAIAEGRSGIPSASSRSQAAVQIRDAVFRYDPTFSEQRAQVRKALTTGPEGKNVGALNTAIVHLGRLGDTAESLKNGSFTPGNEAYNWLRDKFGSETVTNFGLLKDAVAGEMAAALKGNATDIEIEKMGKSIRAANSPAQMRGVIQEGMGILADKAQTYDERYHREMPDDKEWSPILPSARDQLKRHGVGKSEKKDSGGRKPLSEIFK